ncbi:hypothetical protein M8C21_008839 [Ambrosia artemisiifolia]|uniref:Uncharacterized protein n=1 Tax=Ambrosia artemisiifolia TaxID=4212 RepID=A0AAD5C130_AMBAR|nr:hypothetical protein M8C21_008839 [Ambrosia artemisiifolia]
MHTAISDHQHSYTPNPYAPWIGCRDKSHRDKQHSSSIAIRQRLKSHARTRRPITQPTINYREMRIQTQRCGFSMIFLQRPQVRQHLRLMASMRFWV